MKELSVRPILYIEKKKSIAFDLRNVPGLDAAVAKPHMDIMWREQGFKSSDVEAVQAIANLWISKRNATKVAFSLFPEGEKVRFVSGELEALARHIRYQTNDLVQRGPFFVRMSK